MKKYIYILTVWGLGTLSAYAGLSQYAGVTGFVDLGGLRAFESGSEVTEVIIGDKLIGVVAGAVAVDEPEFGAMLRNIRLVHVHRFGVAPADREDLEDHVSGLSSRLDEEGWETVVRTRDGEAQSHVYLMPEGENDIRGLCVLSLDGSAATFVNIVGSINMETLSRLGEQFDALDGLDDMLDGVSMDPVAPTNSGSVAAVPAGEAE